tara:strand:+ start:425 stop:805 length:381 start_codon:yes stop_codon:yes gene_type:complete
MRVERTWERATMLYALLVVGYCDPVVGALLSAILLLHICEKPPTETLVIEKMHPAPKALSPSGAQPPERSCLPPSNPTDPSFLLTEEMLARTQTNHVGHPNTFPNETKSPGVNIQGIFDDITGVQA